LYAAANGAKKHGDFWVYVNAPRTALMIRSHNLRQCTKDRSALRYNHYCVK
jgi:hypothetical protein